MLRTAALLIASLLLTHVFFLEYRPGLHRVEIPYDLKNFHYPILDYAYQSLSEGRLPQWDPSLYSGLPFAANIQAALFYPPSWALFAASAPRPRLRYQQVEDFVFLHVGLAFVLCFAWLRWRRLHPLAAFTGAAIFAFSGHMMTQLQHQGIVTGNAWLPLAFWGVDHAARDHRWQPLWKTAVASALAFLAGFTTFWSVFAVATLAFAAAQPRRWRILAQTTAALFVSLCLAAVQFLPAWEASAFIPKLPRYIGHRDPLFYLSFLLPNYFDFALQTPRNTNPGFDYFYLGCAALVGLVAAARHLRAAAPGLAVLAVSWFFLCDPLLLVETIVNRLPAVTQIVRGWYFSGGITAGVAIVSAIGLDAWLRRQSPTLPNWVALAASAAALAWSARLLWLWNPAHSRLAAGPWSAADAAASMALAASCFWLFPRSSPRTRAALSAAVILLVCAEYKAFGTSKRFNAEPVLQFLEFPNSPIPSLHPAVIARMRAAHFYRTAIYDTALFPAQLRHAGLTTPQGFDPFIPLPYSVLIGPHRFYSEREFHLQPADRDLLSLLGVAFFLTRDGLDAPFLTPDFERLQPAAGYLHVYRWKHAQPPWGWETGQGAARSVEWTPERRRFQIRSSAGGVFRLSEQFFPGWTATLNGHPAPLHRCRQALQCLDIPPGQHTLTFQFQSRWLAAGALLSLASASILALAVLTAPSRSIVR